MMLPEVHGDAAGSLLGVFFCFLAHESLQSGAKATKDQQSSCEQVIHKGAEMWLLLHSTRVVRIIHVVCICMPCLNPSAHLQNRRRLAKLLGRLRLLHRG